MVSFVTNVVNLMLVNKNKFVHVSSDSECVNLMLTDAFYFKINVFREN